MTIQSGKELVEHWGHDVEVVYYGDRDHPASATIECNTCGTVLICYEDDEHEEVEMIKPEQDVSLLNTPDDDTNLLNVASWFLADECARNDMDSELDFGARYLTCLYGQIEVELAKRENRRLPIGDASVLIRELRIACPFCDEWFEDDGTRQRYDIGETIVCPACTRTSIIRYHKFPGGGE